MAEATNIAWATSTFNPWIGCTKIGPGCDHCYAEELDVMRFSRTLPGTSPAIPIIHWGAGAPRYHTAPSNWRQPFKWNEKAGRSGEPWRVFCSSLADVFDNEVPAKWRLGLGHVIWKTPHLTWMLLTKRIGNFEMAMRDFNWAHLPPNVWMGITVVTQEEADRDIPKLLDINAHVRWLSIEPQLEAIDISRYLERGATADNGLREFEAIDWVITGGESGKQARLYDVAWPRDLQRQCAATETPIFVKQLGSKAGLTHWAGADPNEWPEDLRVRQFPQ